MLFRAASLYLLSSLTRVSAFVPPMRPDGINAGLDNTEVYYNNDHWNDYYETTFQQQLAPHLLDGPQLHEMMHHHPHHPTMISWEEHQHQQMMMYDGQYGRFPPMQNQFGPFFDEEPNMMMPDSHYEQEMMMMNGNRHSLPHPNQPYDNNNMAAERSFQPDTPLRSNEASPSGATMFRRPARDEQRPGHNNQSNQEMHGGREKPMGFSFASSKEDPRETIVGLKKTSMPKMNNAPRNFPNGYDPSA